MYTPRKKPAIDLSPSNQHPSPEEALPRMVIGAIGKQTFTFQKILFDLNTAGHQVVVHDTLMDLHRSPLPPKWDLVVLNLLDGTKDLLIEFRKRHPRMLIVCTCNHSVPLKINYFKLGADIILSPPFEPEELRAYLHVIWRHHEGRSAVCHAGWCLRNQRLHHMKRTYVLTQQEAKLVRLFLLSPEVALSREDLMLGLYGNAEGWGVSRKVDTLVCFLRQKIPVFPVFTVRSVGYVFSSRGDDCWLDARGEA